jgi:outer membrane protein assembly factor BamB
MTIKVQCGCGTRYSFEVEPKGGVMPFSVQCPACGADGTQAANEIIAQTPAGEHKTQARLRVAVAAPVSVPQPLSDLPPASRPSGAPLQRIKAEARRTRRLMWAAYGVIFLILAALGGWVWFQLIGSQPRLAFTIKLPPATSAWRAQYFDTGKILLANSERVIARDLGAEKELWSVALPDNGSSGVRPPQVWADKQGIWVCTATQVFRLDQQTGQVKLTVPIDGRLAGFIPDESGVAVVSAPDETRRTVMRIDGATGEISRQEVEAPRVQKHAMPDELPANVLPTAGVLLAQATEEQKFNQPLDAVSSEFFPAGQNLVEMRVKLLEPKINWVKSIKPRGPSLINGSTTASTSAFAVEAEVINDIKRDQTGGVKGIDESRYEVRLRRWTGGQPVEWKDEVTGVPAFFSLATVDLVTAGKRLIVFDKQNNKLFETPLSYPIGDRFLKANPFHAAPAAERAGVLYFFDQARLNALELPGGKVKWGLTSVGISHLQFDQNGMLYIDSTAATLDDIQYTEQIKVETTQAVILKVDPVAGKVLWQVQDRGQRCHLTGKFLYTVSAEQGGAPLLVGLAEAVNAPRPGAPVFFHMYRLDPETGKMLWRFYREEAPDEETFQQNSFVLRFGDEVQVWKYLTY